MGIGKEKAQITVTLTVTEEGEILGPQFIFGGKTDKCHPATPPPTGGFYTHTKSHWQTPESFEEWVTKVLLPYKLKIIRQQQLPPEQRMILLLDLHYSHKDDKISLPCLAKYNIIPVYTPAGCTDIIQVLDVYCNKPFKSAVRKAFRDYLHLSFKNYVEVLKGAPEQWVAPLKLSEIKPVLPNWVGKGIEMLSTLTMKEGIRNCFKAAGRLALCRSQEQQAKIRESMGLVLRLVVPAGVERDDDPFDEDDDDENDGQERKSND